MACQVIGVLQASLRSLQEPCKVGEVLLKAPLVDRDLDSLEGGITLTCLHAVTLRSPAWPQRCRFGLSWLARVLLAVEAQQWLDRLAVLPLCQLTFAACVELGFCSYSI